MSDNTGTYILQTKDGYRIRWGAYIERVAAGSKAFRKMFRLCPYFVERSAAMLFAKEVEAANGPTEFGIVFIDLYKNKKFDDLS